MPPPPLPSTSAKIGRGFSTIRIVVIKDRYVVQRRWWWWPFWDFVDSYSIIHDANRAVDDMLAERRPKPAPQVLREE